MTATAVASCPCIPDEVFCAWSGCINKLNWTGGLHLNHKRRTRYVTMKKILARYWPSCSCIWDCVLFTYWWGKEHLLPAGRPA